MTEDEAKSKWCPFARGLIRSGTNMVAGNRIDNIETDPKATCIGADCMAWRWTDYEWTGNPSMPERAGGVNGHCGLAGKP